MQHCNIVDVNEHHAVPHMSLGQMVTAAPPRRCTCANLKPSWRRIEAALVGHMLRKTIVLVLRQLRQGDWRYTTPISLHRYEMYDQQLMTNLNCFSWPHVMKDNCTGIETNKA